MLKEENVLLNEAQSLPQVKKFNETTALKTIE